MTGPSTPTTSVPAGAADAFDPGLVLGALGLPVPGSTDALPLAVLDGRPLTVTARLSARALAVAAERGTPLLVVDPDREAPGPGVAITGGPGRARPWPVVVLAASPWAVAGADLGLLVGERGPADADGLDEAAAAEVVRRFLDRSADGPPAEPDRSRSLIDVVPWPIDEPWPAEEVLAALVDGGGWVELAAGAADEVLTVAARLGGRSVGVAVSRPGADGGRLGPDGWARVERLVEWCERGGRPFVSLVDSAGIVGPDTAVDLDLLRRVAARVRRAEVTKLAVVVGRAVGLAATILGPVGARADLVVAWPRARFALAPPPPGLDPGEADRLASVDRAATEGDLLDVIHPDRTRAVLVELLDLVRGRREHTA